MKSRKYYGLELLVALVLAMVMVGSGACAKDAKEKPNCGKLVSKAQLEKLLGSTVEFNEQAKLDCSFSAGKGATNDTGTIQVFVGNADKNYGQMLSGARATLKKMGKITEPNDIGKKTFFFTGKIYRSKMMEFIFIDSSGGYTVLVSMGAGWAQEAKLRKLANIINSNLGKL